jgi:hypothetical protein
MFPKRRVEGLLTEELPNETIVYDTTNHKVHCLNPVARAVWQRCDGRTSEAELAQILERKLGQPAGEALVQLTLAKLGHADLLEGQTGFTTPTSRREMARQLARLGIAAATALVATIAAPTMAQAATIISCGPGMANCGCQSTFTCFVSGGVCQCLPSNTQGLQHCSGC